MHADRLQDIKAGTDMPQFSSGTVDRTMLALFAGASGDHNPIHLDDEKAREGGLPGVIIHGMLMMAILGRAVTNWVPQSHIKKFSTRFAAMATPGDEIICSGKVAAINGSIAELELVAQNQSGKTLLNGLASVDLAKQDNKKENNVLQS